MLSFQTLRQTKQARQSNNTHSPEKVCSSTNFHQSDMHRLGRDIHIFGEQIKTEVIAIINYKIFRTNRINLCIPHPYLSTLLFVKGFRNRPFTLTIIALCTAASHLFTSTCLFNFLLLSFFIHSIG